MLEDPRTDDQLLMATPREPAAFGAFYRRHEDTVLGWFLWRTGRPELAGDLAAETFASALGSASRYRPAPAPAQAWLFGIARNVLAMSARRGRVEARARRRLGMAPIVLDDATLERITELEDGAAAAQALDRLPATQRDAVRRRVIEEREYADIAQELRCSEQVVRKRVSRGLATLRVELEESP